MMTIFSERLVILRKQVGKTQNDVSKELKIALRAYQNYEYGTAEPRLSTLVKLADFTVFPWIIWRAGGIRRRGRPMWPSAGSPPRNVSPSIP